MLRCHALLLIHCDAGGVRGGGQELGQGFPHQHGAQRIHLGPHGRCLHRSIRIRCRPVGRVVVAPSAVGVAGGAGAGGQGQHSDAVQRVGQLLP